MRRDGKRAVMIGGGVESLVTACYLARHGLQALVLEKRSEPGGTHAPWPEGRGFPVSLVFDDVSSLHATIVRDLALERCGLTFATGPSTLAALDPEGRLLELSHEPGRSRAAIAAFSQRDAQAYDRFSDTLARVVRAIRPIVQRAPPGDRLNANGLWTALLTGRRYLALSRREAFELLRWPPMPVADLVDEWFESEPLRALVASRGLFGAFAGARSAGTTGVLLLRAAAENGLVPRVPGVAGGAAALVSALVARARDLGVEMRMRTEVTRVLAERDGVTGVELADGSRVEAGIVVSGLDPRRTLLGLLEPEVLTPDLARRASNIRTRGTIARVLIMVDELPPLAGSNRGGRELPRTVHVLPDLEGLERAFDAAKYGTWAESPWLEVTTHVPSDASEGDTRRRALSVTAHLLPNILRHRQWSDVSEVFGDLVVQTLERHVPGLSSRVSSPHVLSPEGIASELGLTGGHPLHAELALDQLWIARPALGLGGYRSPLSGLYRCGPGTHPGLGPLGTSGLETSRAVVRDLRGKSRA